MDIRSITDDYAVSAQIEPTDVEAIRAAGFRSIVCHRPDGEETDQPSAANVQEAAEKAGLGFRHIPVISGQLTTGNVSAMRAALDELEGPVFAYCRSGARSTNIFGLAEQIKD